MDELIFEVNLLFDKDKSAIEAFSQITKIYEVLNDYDRLVIRNIGQGILTNYELQDVEVSSLKTKLRQVLTSIPDDIVKDLEIKKVFGYLLVKVKYWLIKLLADENEITSKDQIEKVTNKINDELKEIGNTYQLFITQVNNYTVLNSVEELIKETKNLKDKELIEYKSYYGNAFVSNNSTINKPQILKELGQTSITNETTEILKIKRIEMLSDQPKWDFLQGKKTISAKMLDKGWVNDFHSRNIIIRPEDALMVTLRTTHTYSSNFTDTKTDFEIVKILQVVSPDDNNVTQLRLGD